MLFHHTFASDGTDPRPSSRITSYGHASTHTPHPAQSSDLKSSTTDFPCLYLVDLLICDRIYGIEFKCTDRACDHTITTASTTLHVYVHCKCHVFFTHQIGSIKKSTEEEWLSNIDKLF